MAWGERAINSKEPTRSTQRTRQKFAWWERPEQRRARGRCALAGERASARDSGARTLESGSGHAILLSLGRAVASKPPSPAPSSSPRAAACAVGAAETIVALVVVAPSRQPARILRTAVGTASRHARRNAQAQRKKTERIE